MSAIASAVPPASKHAAITTAASLERFMALGLYVLAPCAGSDREPVEDLAGLV